MKSRCAEQLRGLAVWSTHAGVIVLTCALMLRGQVWAARVAGLPVGDARLWAALAADDHDKIRRAIAEGADVNRPDERGQLPLIVAAGMGTAEMVGELLKQGADVTAVNSDGVSPLLAAVYVGRQGNVERLLAAGADPLARSLLRPAPLDVAVQNENAKIIALLLARLPANYCETP